MCTVVAGLPLQLVVVGGVGDVALSYAVLSDWVPVLQITRGKNGSQTWVWPEWAEPQPHAYRMPGKSLLPPAALLLQLLVGPQVLVGIQHVAQIIRAQQAREEAAVGWTGKVTLGVEQELRRRVFVSKIHRLIPPTPYTPHLYHKVSGWISGQLGELCGQLSEGGATCRINHPT